MGISRAGPPRARGRLLEAWRTIAQRSSNITSGSSRRSGRAASMSCRYRAESDRAACCSWFYRKARCSWPTILRCFGCCGETAVQLDNTTMSERQQKLITELGERSDQLAAVNRELEAFSYSVSHDLRAPLRHVSGFTELLQKSEGLELDDTGRRYLRLISESAVKMGELIDALLVFSRMGRAEMLHTRVDLNSIVRHGAAGCDAGRSGAARVAWVIHPLPEVPGDPSMLQLVFTNLLSNAFKYSRTARERRRSKSGARMAIQQRGRRFRPRQRRWLRHGVCRHGCSACFSGCIGPRSSRGPDRTRERPADRRTARRPGVGRERARKGRDLLRGAADVVQSSDGVLDRWASLSRPTNTRIFLGRTYSRSPIFGFSAS